MWCHPSNSFCNESICDKIANYSREMDRDVGRKRKKEREIEDETCEGETTGLAGRPKKTLTKFAKKNGGVLGLGCGDQWRKQRETNVVSTEDIEGLERGSGRDDSCRGRRVRSAASERRRVWDPLPPIWEEIWKKDKTRKILPEPGRLTGRSPDLVASFHGPAELL